MITILGIKIIDRIKEAGLTQSILSKHGAVITTRLGFHEVTDEICSREAYIILHLRGDQSEAEILKSELMSLGGVEIRQMIFNTNTEELNIESEDSSVEILGILAGRDPEIIGTVQRILTSYGCSIRTRLGVNEKFYGEPAGLIILELKGDARQRLLLEKDLKDVKQVCVRTMVF